MSRGTGSLTEDAIAQILKGTDVVDLLKAKEANEEIRRLTIELDTANKSIYDKER